MQTEWNGPNATRGEVWKGVVERGCIERLLKSSTGNGVFWVVFVKWLVCMTCHINW